MAYRIRLGRPAGGLVRRKAPLVLIVLEAVLLPPDGIDIMISMPLTIEKIEQRDMNLTYLF